MMDFDTWMHDVGCDRIFRLLIKRTPGDWTPHEMEQKFSDQGHYVDDHYTLVTIIETIELPDKDVLIGFKSVEDVYDCESSEYENYPIEYRKLSEIELAFFPTDMIGDEDCEEE